MIRAWRLLRMMLGFTLAASSPALAIEECELKVEWQSIYDSGPVGASQDRYFDLAEDSKGNIYVCGIANTQLIHMLWRIEKFDPNGDLLWAVNWSPYDETGYSAALRLAVTPDDGVVVVGWASPLNVSLAVKKYDSFGNCEWTFLHRANDATTYGHSIAVNNDGEVYVGGRDIADNILLIKLNSAGSPLWIKDTSMSGHLNDLAVLPNGDLIGSGTIDLAYAPAIHRFDSQGNLKWTWKDETLASLWISGLAVDASRGCFFGIGTDESTRILKFPDDPDAEQGIPEWIGTYAGANAGGIAVDDEGSIWAAGQKDSLWTIYRFESSTLAGVPPNLICTISDYDWTTSHGYHGGEETVDGISSGSGIICTRDKGVASCGYMLGGTGFAQNAEVVKLRRDVSDGFGTGPVANGSPTEPGPEHPGGLKPGDVRVAGGTRGLVDPRRGEGASVSVYPTSAGTVTLTVIDRKGGVVKQVSAPASGSGTVNLTWDGTNESGAPAAPGIYAVRVEGPGIRQVSKVAVVY